MRPDMQIKEGDYLVAINGRRLQKNEDFHRWLQVAKGQKVALTVNSRPTPEGARTYEVEPLRQDRQLRYNRWLTDNIQKVLKATDGRVGYMHINAMGVGQHRRVRQVLAGVPLQGGHHHRRAPQLGRLDGILHDRQAGAPAGGLQRPARHGALPSTRAASARKATLPSPTNTTARTARPSSSTSRRAGSARWSAPPSWGGLVGILNAQRTVDNGSVNQPNNAFYGKAGQWWVENRGAIPDIEVENDPNLVMAGRDPQLEKAIEVVLAAIAKNDKNKFPPVPAYPDKR